LHIPRPGGHDPTIPEWGYHDDLKGSFFTAHIDSANPRDDLWGLLKHWLGDVLLKLPHGC
jgi:hypothetical protein